MLTICDRLSNFDDLAALANAELTSGATVGVHPHEAKDYHRLEPEELMRRASLPRVVGIGETGL